MQNENSDIKKIVDEMWNQPVQFYNTEGESKKLDLTPTWSGLLLVMLEINKSTSAPLETKGFIITEFRKMAQAADLHNSSKKKIEIIANKLEKIMSEYNVSSGLHNELIHVKNMLTSVYEK